MAKTKAKGGSSGKAKGFASLADTDPDRLREIAAKGGQAAAKSPAKYRWGTAEAKAAGRKGGLASRGGRVRVLGRRANG